MYLSSNQQQRLRENYGSWALVSGASSGIGREIAHELAAAGFNLVLNARSEKLLRESAEEIQQQFGTAVQFIPADLATDEGIEQLISKSRQYDIGLLVASAGFGTSGSFLHTSIHAERNMIRVNCEGLLSLTHHFAQSFSRQKRGGIILMSSLVAFQGVPFAANYAATKAYVQSLAEGLSIELKEYGIDVLAAAPGPVDSGFGKRANMQMDMSLRPDQVAGPILAALGKKQTVLPGKLTKFLIYEDEQVYEIVSEPDEVLDAEAGE
ncbi:MAG: SDR family oxidoreductase, partial [Bacteroidota bacterium]